MLIKELIEEFIKAFVNLCKELLSCCYPEMGGCKGVGRMGGMKQWQN